MVAPHARLTCIRTQVSGGRSRQTRTLRRQGSPARPEWATVNPRQFRYTPYCRVCPSPAGPHRARERLAIPDSNGDAVRNPAEEHLDLACPDLDTERRMARQRRRGQTQLRWATAALPNAPPARAVMRKSRTSLSDFFGKKRPSVRRWLSALRSSSRSNPAAESRPLVSASPTSCTVNPCRTARVSHMSPRSAAAEGPATDASNGAVAVPSATRAPDAFIMTSRFQQRQRERLVRGPNIGIANATFHLGVRLSRHVVRFLGSPSCRPMRRRVQARAAVIGAKPLSVAAATAEVAEPSAVAEAAGRCGLTAVGRRVLGC